MKLRRLVRGDIHFQWKYGFYFIYFVLTVIYVFGITALPDNWKHNAAAIMIYSDPAAMGLFFMGAIVLLEKSQRYSMRLPYRRQKYPSTSLPRYFH